MLGSGRDSRPADELDVGAGVPKASTDPIERVLDDVASATQRRSLKLLLLLGVLLLLGLLSLLG